MWKTVVVMGYLVCLSVCDVRSRAVPKEMLAAGGVTAVIYAGVQIWCDYGQAGKLMAGILPGALLLALSMVSEEIGKGDGAVMMIIGSVLEYRESFAVFAAGLFIMSVFAVFAMLLKKADRRSRLPFLPFLTLGMMLVEGTVMKTARVW